MLVNTLSLSHRFSKSASQKAEHKLSLAEALLTFVWRASHSSLRVSLRLVALSVLVLTLVLPSFPHVSASQWVEYSGNPVLSGTPNSWDADYVVSPRVLYDQNARAYRMWYSGGNRTGTNGIGYATSTNGIAWTKYTGAALVPGSSGSWDSAVVQLGSVVWNGTTFLMWYRGNNATTNDRGAIGFATSADGVSWSKYAGNPVLQTTQVDQGYLGPPFVVKLNITLPYPYDMWYTGRSATYPAGNTLTRIYYAGSNDGIHWNKWSSTVLNPSSFGAWDSGAVYSPSVYFNGTSFALAYSGLNQSLAAPQIGFAASPDGVTWTKYSMNPILGPGPAQSWDSAGVEQPNLILGAVNAFLLYYDGFSKSGATSIGLAQPPQGFLVPEYPDAIFPILVIGTLALVAAFARYKRRL